jgi:hypothetical protein
MPGFLYFLPGRETAAPKPEQIDEAGLSYAFDSKPHLAGVRKGPDGHSGHVLGDKRRWELGLVKFSDQSQQWRKHPSGKFYVGRYTTERTRPDDLKRKLLLDGYFCELADGNAWLIPKGREYYVDESGGDVQGGFFHKLPRVADLDEEGRWQILDRPMPRYQTLWDLTIQWNEVRRGDPEPGWTERWQQYDEQMNGACLALAANYAVGPVEVAMMGLLTIQHAKEVLDLVIDDPGFERFKKKWLAHAELQIAASSGSTSPVGLEAEPAPIIAPPSPT